MSGFEGVACCKKGDQSARGPWRVTSSAETVKAAPAKPYAVARVPCGTRVDKIALLRYPFKTRPFSFPLRHPPKIALSSILRGNILSLQGDAAYKALHLHSLPCNGTRVRDRRELGEGGSWGGRRGAIGRAKEHHRSRSYVSRRRCNFVKERLAR